MEKHFNLRAGTAGDAAAISALILSLQPYLTIEPDGSGAEEFLVSLSPDIIRRNLQDENYRYQLAYDGDLLAGVVAVRDNAHLFSLYVGSAWHGQGLGKRLWQVARDAALARGNPGSFTVNSSSFAESMYRHLGFTATGPVAEMHGIRFIPMRLDLAQV
ncbi:GNAT family N-acetyltransferase [Pseudoduganella eburnea]|uniref:GNAT family N-acetyltransferase n=1 Tax=Massilia eburnea TaxID=1776165 RepID=A0A6L6QIB7_9BURK|nr:GNAT family N-acetyltransferase [Massilia eburnea]MTW11376.1 GNAT family N-acetyltransferase [Massilia eburnea]